MQKRLECIYIHVNIKRCFQVNIYASINIILSKFICVMGQKKDYALCSLFPFQMFIPSLKYFNICIVFSAVQCKECKMDSNYIVYYIINIMNAWYMYDRISDKSNAVKQTMLVSCWFFFVYWGRHNKTNTQVRIENVLYSVNYKNNINTERGSNW